MFAEKAGIPVRRGDRRAGGREGRDPAGPRGGAAAVDPEGVATVDDPGRGAGHGEGAARAAGRRPRGRVRSATRATPSSRCWRGSIPTASWRCSKTGWCRSRLASCIRSRWRSSRTTRPRRSRRSRPTRVPPRAPRASWPSPTRRPAPTARGASSCSTARWPRPGASRTSEIRLRILGHVADRWLELDDLDRAKPILREGQAIVAALPQDQYFRASRSSPTCWP